MKDEIPGEAQSAEESGSDLNRLESYKPIYFLMGSPNTKIEVSLKTKVIEGFNLYVGYSQLMMWELFRKSPYFSDLNYNPEIFYRMVLKADSKMIPTRWLDFGGFEHESNGKGGVNERSWNRSYLRYHDEVDSTMGSRVYWSIKAWGPYSLNSLNSDLPKYRGIWEINITFTQFTQRFLRFLDDFTLRLYPGGDLYINPTRGGQEFTFRSRVPLFGSLKPLFVFQIFHGYGENLSNYKDNQLGVRAGLGF